jgi:uncharacterized phosphosugar-binding protein
MTSLISTFPEQVYLRLQAIEADVASGAFDPAIEILVTALAAGGVLHAFGTGHSEAFAMEIAGRAGGFIPTHRMGLRDLMLLGKRDRSVFADEKLERDPAIGDEIFELYDVREDDVILIASNSGANGSTVGLALRAKAEGLPVIAVTSLAHSCAVTSKHSSGRRLFEVADVVIDNRAPYGDATLELTSGMKIGAVSSITAAFIAQLLTIGAAEKLKARDVTPPMYISANVPGGDEHNDALVEEFGLRIRPYHHFLA